VTVETGLGDGVYTEITGGDLKEGDHVVLAEAGKTGAAAPTRPPAGPGGRRGMGF